MANLRKTTRTLITISTNLYFDIDEDGEIMSDLYDEAEEQLENAIRSGDYEIEEVELD